VPLVEVLLVSGPYANGSFFSSAQSLELSSSEDSSSSEEIVTSLRGVAGRFFVASRANPGLTDGVGVGSGADTLLGEGGGGAHGGCGVVGVRGNGGCCDTDASWKRIFKVSCKASVVGANTNLFS